MSLLSAQLFTLLVSSSVLAAVLSIAGNHFLASRQFKREYFKEIIARRLRAYECVHEIVGILKGITYDDHGRTIHVLFMNRALYDRSMQLTATAIGLSLYLSEQTYSALFELNMILLKPWPDMAEHEAFEMGVTNRADLTRVRQQLEHTIAADLTNLYRVASFLRAKRASTLKQAPRLANVPRDGAFSFGEETADDPKT